MFDELAKTHTTVYLAGKITGEDTYAYQEKFHLAETQLTLAGFVVANPAWLPPKGFSYEAYIRMSAALLAECKSACFLKCWVNSGGAQGEFGRAMALGKCIFFYEDFLNWTINGEQKGAIYNAG